MNRRAKILATIGPACDSRDGLRSLLRAGADGFRLNFSHGTRQEHAAAIERARQVAEQEKRPLAIVQDLQGPKLRTGELASGDKIELSAGSKLVLTTEVVEGTSERLHVNYQPLPDDVSPGDRILLDDGKIELQVVDVQPPEVVTEVVVGGPLGRRKGINLPGVKLSAPPLTEKDIQDLKFGHEHGVDMVAMSFVRSGNDLVQLQSEIDQLYEGRLPVLKIGKLERQEAIEHLQEILEASEGVMVARGDLGVELAAERVPSLQKQIISDANARNRLVITATQMLDSMIRNPRPTRAEASDVANAVFDGTDVLMLSGETAVGAFPERAVSTMDRIIRDAESHSAEWGFRPTDDFRLMLDDASATTRAASELADDRGAKAIGVFTRSGRTGLLMSKARPTAPILAFTPETKTYQRMSLFWGVEPHLIPMAKSVEEMIDHMEMALLESRLVGEGDRVVLIASLPVGALGPANLIYLHTLGEQFRRAEGDQP